MSLDVSPDGRTLVFDLLGDLYQLPIKGGTAKRLTTGMSFNQQPRYSPDGRQLTFVSDRGGSPNVWIMDRDGGNARPCSNLHSERGRAVTSPAWAPDGRTIVASVRLAAARPGIVSYKASLRWFLVAYNAATGHMRWVSDTAPDRARSALGPAFSPDGGTIYAAVEPPLAEVDGERSYETDYRVARVDATTGRILPATWLLAGRAGWRPAVTRDGRYLVYATSSGSHLGLRLRDLRTERERWLVREVLDDPPLWLMPDLVPGYALTPDSKAVVAAYGGKIHRIDVADGRTVVIPFVANVERGLGPLAVRQYALPDTAERTRSVMQPALSPDGRRVAFSALDRVWVMELPHDGQPAQLPRRLTADSVGEFYPSWSPDGRWIVYTTWLDGEGGAVRRARPTLDSSGSIAPSERLTADTALYFHTAVSLDGERVLAVRSAVPPERLLTHDIPGGPPLDLALVWVPAGGGWPRPITSLPSAAATTRSPVDQLYLTTNPARLYLGLTSWRWDGTDQKTAVSVAEHEDSLSFIADVAGVLSPDGRRALLTHRHALFEVGLPTTATEKGGGPDPVDLDEARMAAFGTATGAAHRWGTARAPWIAWSRDGRRVLFNQGGTFFVGDVTPGHWTTFTRVDVPLRVPVDIPRGTIVLHGARLITMRGREIIGTGDLVVRDNRIAAAGPVGTVEIPADARILDVSGKTILPGYVDVHDHVPLQDGVHPQQCWLCLVRLAYGVTTVRDPWPAPWFYNDVFAYRERERSGDLLGPRVFSTGAAYDETDLPIRGLEDARDVVRPYVEYFGSETFKVESYTADRRTRQLIETALAEQGLNGTVHVDRADQALTVAIDGFSGIEHLIPIRLYDDAAIFIARSGTTHTQTYASILGWDYMLRRYGAVWGSAKMRRFAPPSARAFACVGCQADEVRGKGLLELANVLPLVTSAAQIVANGGRVAVGSHGNLPGVGYHYEMWFYAWGGMPSHEVLRSATIVGATAIGHARDFGSIEPGKLADLQILDRNPLADIQNTLSIRYVMKNGRLYRAGDLTQIWPDHESLPRIYFWDTKGLDSTHSVHHSERN